MKFSLRQATWIFAISVGLLFTPGLAQSQDNHGGGQDRGQGNQQGDRHDNDQNDRGQGNQQGDRHDNDQNDRHRDHRDGLPYGGYMQTCRDVQTYGSTLQASCEKRNGSWRQTSLRHFNRCVSSIENNNGKLVCSR
jgi:CVNH domain